MASKRVSYLEGYAFENNFDALRFHNWMMKNASSVSVSLSVIYVITIFGIKMAMERKKRYELRYPLAIWSTVLAIFSTLGAVRTGADFYYTLRYKGLQFSICDTDYTTTPPIGLWCSLFALSKPYELGDTLFIVLRKQPLIFLHWYHHITVMLYVYNLYTDTPGTARWFMTMNYTVHAFMYTYYSLRAFRFKIPRQVNLCITLLQLSQMIVGFIINVLAYKIRFIDEKPCHASYFSIIWGLLMYISYFILFANFFYNTYLKPKDDHRRSKATETKGHPPVANGEVSHKHENSFGDNVYTQNGAVRQRVSSKSA